MAEINEVDTVIEHEAGGMQKETEVIGNDAGGMTARGNEAKELTITSRVRELDSFGGGDQMAR